MERTKETNIFQDFSLFLKKWWSSILNLFGIVIGFFFLVLACILADPFDPIFISIYGFGILFLGIFAFAYNYLCYLLRKSSGSAPEQLTEEN